MLKFELIPAQLLHEGTFTNGGLFAALPCKAAIVLITYTWEYINKLLQQTLSEKEQSPIGFPQSTQLTLLKSYCGCGMQAKRRDRYLITLNSKYSICSIAGGAYFADIKIIIEEPWQYISFGKRNV